MTKYPIITVDKDTQSIAIQLKKGKPSESTEYMIPPNIRIIADKNKKNEVITLEILWF